MPFYPIDLCFKFDRFIINSTLIPCLFTIFTFRTGNRKAFANLARCKIDRIRKEKGLSRVANF